MIKNWVVIASGVVAAGTILAVLGFNSPASSAQETKAELRTLTHRVDKHDVMFAEQRVDLTYIKQGIDDLKRRR